MATKTAGKEAEKAKPATPFPAKASGVDKNGLRWEEVDVFGTTYHMREITVDEGDAAYDASRNEDGTFNGRLNTRMELVSSVESPTITLDEIGAWGTLKLRALLYVFDRINNLPPADTEGNA